MAYLTPENPTSNALITITAGNTLVPFLVGALVSLSEGYRWEQFGAMTVEEVLQAVNSAISTLTEEYSNPGYPNVVPVFIFESSGNSGTWAKSYQVTSPTLLRVQGASSNGIWIEYTVSLGAGTWKLETHTAKTNNFGILSTTFNGTELGQADLYNPVIVQPFQLTYEGITVPADGTYVLHYQTAGKNASSGGYYQEIYGIKFTRTGS